MNNQQNQTVVWGKGSGQIKLMRNYNQRCAHCGKTVQASVAERYHWADRKGVPDRGYVVNCSCCGSRICIPDSYALPEATVGKKSGGQRPKLVVPLIMLVLVAVVMGVALMWTIGSRTDPNSSPKPIADTNESADSAMEEPASAMEEEPEALGQVGSYVVRTDNQDRLNFYNSNESGIPYGGIVYATKFEETDDGMKAYVQYAAVTGWVSMEELSWLSTENYSISVGDVCYVHKRAEEGMNLRQEASSDSASLATLYYGTEIKINSLNGRWGKTSYDGTEGWVLMQRIAKYVPELQYMTDSLDASYTAMKESMDMDSETVAELPNGIEVEITAYEAGWGTITYDGSAGYVRMCDLTPVSEK